MKINFYISCESSEETAACIKFISDMEARRLKSPHVVAPGPIFTPKASVPIAAPEDDESEEMNGGGVVERKNVSPGASGIGKIGQSTKDTLINMLTAGMQPAEKMSEHMKLLWSRGEVKFDGKEYYL